MVDGVKGLKSTVGVANDLVLPEGAPQFSEAEVAECLRRSSTAAELHQHIEDVVNSGATLSKADVDDLIARAYGGKQKPDTESVVVLAAAARRHPHCFKHGGKALTKFFKKVDWSELRSELGRFMSDLAARAAEEKRQQELKKQILEDDIKADDQKRQLIKDNGTAAERQAQARKVEAQKQASKSKIRDSSERDLEEELTASGRLKLSDVELGKLQLLKKGFANKS